jgi:AraC-like DNA-binding protein
MHAGEAAKEIEGCLRSFLDNQRGEKALNRIYINALSMQLFVLAMRCIESGSSVSSDNILLNDMDHGVDLNHYRIVSALRDYLIEHYRENISLAAVAKNMYISPEYLGRIFKSGMGQSPMSFLISIRLEKAKELLENGDLTVAQISRQIGYNDVYHFSKLFKKHFSISPLMYRKLTQTGGVLPEQNERDE